MATNIGARYSEIFGYTHIRGPGAVYDVMDRNLEKHPYRNSKLETGDLISYNYLNGLFDTYRADITYYGDLETQ